MAGKTGALVQVNPMRAKRDLTIIALRGEGKSFSQIGKLLNLSKGRIGQILSDVKVKEKLEDELSSFFCELSGGEPVDYIESDDWEKWFKELLEAKK